MFRNPLSLLALSLCWSVAVGFAPTTTPSLKIMSPKLTLSSPSPSSLYMSEQAPHEDDTDAAATLEAIPLALKMAGVLAIKTAKDVVNYPPMLLDQAMRDSQQQRNENNKLPQTSPLVMLIKLVGVLVFKTVHDAVYYPALWTERMIECQSLEECELD